MPARRSSYFLLPCICKIRLLTLDTVEAFPHKEIFLHIVERFHLNSGVAPRHRDDPYSRLNCVRHKWSHGGFICPLTGRRPLCKETYYPRDRERRPSVRNRECRFEREFAFIEVSNVTQMNTISESRFSAQLEQPYASGPYP